MVHGGEDKPPDEADLLPDFLGDDAGGNGSEAAVDATYVGLVAHLEGDDLPAALAAVDTIAERSVAALQVPVARLLYDRSQHLQFAQIERILDCLATVGDGRCVRVMEAVLHERHFQLTEHQAWRARHIVQRVRRAGRK